MKKRLWSLVLALAMVMSLFAGMTVTASADGGNTEPTTYSVNIASTTNGTVTASPTTAAAGATVTLTVTPADGYELQTLTVKDAGDNTVTVTDNQFTMPAGNVTVTAVFAASQIGSGEDGARIYKALYGDTFLGGDYIELGLRPSGVFGTQASAPVSGDVVFHPNAGWSDRTQIGLRSNGNKKWSEGLADDALNETVDFFLPGTIDEGWLVGWTAEEDGSAAAKGGAQAYGGRYATAVPGNKVDAAVSTKNGKEIITATTTATVAGTVGVEQTIEFDASEKFFTTTVTLTNNGSDTVYDLSYIRAFDPDQRSGTKTSPSDSRTDNYFYKDDKGNIWVMAFGNNSLNITSGYNASALTEVDYNTMVENNSEAITPFVFCAAPSKDNRYTVQAVNTSVGWGLDYNSFYRQGSYLAGDELYGKHYYEDYAIGLEFIVESLGAGQEVSFSWISSLDTDVKAAVGNVQDKVDPIPTPEPEPEPEPPVEEEVEEILPTVDVPVTNDENKVKVSATLSGKDATIAPLSERQIERMVGDKEAAGNVVIDLTGLKQPIDTAGIPKKTVKAIVEAAEDAGNATEQLVIKLTTAQLTLDDAAMRAIVDQARGDMIEFNFDDVGLTRLNKEQKAAVKDMDVRKGYEAYITSNGKRISDFKGGEVQVIVPYDVPAGEDVSGFSVWYIDEDGVAEKLNSIYNGKEKCFVVTHFSDYVLVYNEEDVLADTYADCTGDETCPIHDYSDVLATAWYHDGVHFCLENSLMEGVGGNTFAPGGDATRAQLVTILWRLEGEPMVETAEDFDDVVENAWYYDAIRWASSHAIVEGYGNGSFGPYDVVTREQAVAILWRYAQYKGYDVSVGESTNILSYGDAFDMARYAVPAMQWACGSGMVEGISDGNGGMILDAKGKTTRIQMATMIMRFCMEIEK